MEAIQYPVIARWNIHVADFQNITSFFIAINNIKTLPAKALILTISLNNTEGRHIDDVIPGFPIARSHQIKGRSYQYIDNSASYANYLYKIRPVAFPVSVGQAVFDVRHWFEKKIDSSQVDLLYMMRNSLSNGIILKKIYKSRIA